MKTDREDNRVTLVPENGDEYWELLKTPISKLMEKHQVTEGKELALDLQKGKEKTRLVSVWKNLGQSSYSGKDEVKFE